MRPEESGPWRDQEGPPPALLAEVLAQLQARPGWQERLRGGRVSELWAQIAGDQVAAHAEPVRLRGGLLIVRASSPLWATQLRYLAPTLIARAEELLGPGTVTHVKVVSGGPQSSDQRKRDQ